MARVAAEVRRSNPPRQPVTKPVRLRPGWVYEVVVAVLAAADQPLRPQEVICLAERVHGRPIAPSSIRNCLREAAIRANSSVERHGYGRYGLRQ